MAAGNKTMTVNECKPVKCETCQLTTWAGCGRHIDQVMDNVPEDERCKCPRESK